ncbi:MAG: DUF2059 domain-containing protein [Acidobacteriota bacterium]|nr:DUF2059 domain-containing protein [Acidobacteriota bacterium]
MPIAPSARRIALLLTLAVAFSLTARADDASHRTKAIEMMTILHTERTVQQISENIKKQVADAAEKIAGQTPTEDQKAKIAELEKKANKLVDDQLSWNVMQAGFADVYVKNFTEAQLDVIIAFYKSQAGIALLENMPTVNSQITQFGSSHLNTLQPQLKQLFEDFQKSESAPAPVIGPAMVIPPASATPPASSPK